MIYSTNQLHLALKLFQLSRQDIKSIFVIKSKIYEFASKYWITKWKPINFNEMARPAYVTDTVNIYSFYCSKMDFP